MPSHQCSRGMAALCLRTCASPCLTAGVAVCTTVAMVYVGGDEGVLFEVVEAPGSVADSQLVVQARQTPIDRQSTGSRQDRAGASGVLTACS